MGLELALLGLCLFIVIFLFAFYHLQFPSEIYLNDVDKKNPADYDDIATNDNPSVNDCVAIYQTKDDAKACAFCGGSTYHLIDVVKDQVVNGITLRPGKYCVRDSLPKCDDNKGILLVNGNNNYRCVCKYPHYFDGPSCATKVACGGDSATLLVDRDGEVIDTSYNVDYYAVGAKCKCPSYNPSGLSYLNSNQFPSSQCILDPCLYPTPYLDPDLGLQADGKCKCSSQVPNRGGEYTPCSSCQSSPQEVPDDFGQNGKDSYTITIPSDCYNEFSTVGDIALKYPCAVLRSPVNCGESKLLFGVYYREP